MKGQQPMMIIAILLILALAITSFGATQLSQTLNFAVENSARLQAQRFASIINTAQLSPDDLTVTYKLPRTTCVFEITPMSVRAKVTSGGTEETYESSVLQTTTEIQPTTIDCKSKPVVEIHKRRNTLSVA